jgi:hypothetical protein
MQLNSPIAPAKLLPEDNAFKAVVLLILIRPISAIQVHSATVALIESPCDSIHMAHPLRERDGTISRIREADTTPRSCHNEDYTEVRYHSRGPEYFGKCAVAAG